METGKHDPGEFLPVTEYFTKYTRYEFPGDRYYFNVSDDQLYTKRDNGLYALKLTKGNFKPTATKFKSVNVSLKYLKIQLNITAKEKAAEDLRDGQLKKKAFKALREK
jgi:hypothetical protein